MHAAPLPITSSAHQQEWDQLQATTGGKFHVLFDAVSRAMAHTQRSGSLVENLNSRLRTYFTLCRHLDGSGLDLLLFFLSHWRFMRSHRAERHGKSPEVDGRPRSFALAYPARSGPPQPQQANPRRASRLPRTGHPPSRHLALTGRKFPRALCNHKNGGF